MSVQFDEDNFGKSFYTGNTNSNNLDKKTGSKMGDWLIKSGLASDPSSANMILVITALMVFGLSIYFFIFGFGFPGFGTAQDITDPSILPPGLEIQ